MKLKIQEDDHAFCLVLLQINGTTTFMRYYIIDVKVLI